MKAPRCPNCGTQGELFLEGRGGYQGWQCLSRTCRQCWCICSKCGHITLDGISPRICPSCGADRIPKPKPDQKHKGYRCIVLPNPYGASLMEEIERAERERQAAKLELNDESFLLEVA